MVDLGGSKTSVFAGFQNETLVRRSSQIRSLECWYMIMTVPVLVTGDGVTLLLSVWICGGQQSVESDAIHRSTQIVTKSHDVTPKGGLVGEIQELSRLVNYSNLPNRFVLRGPLPVSCTLHIIFLPWVHDCLSVAALVWEGRILRCFKFLELFFHEISGVLLKSM